MASNCAFVEMKELFDCFFVLLWSGEWSGNKVIPALLPASASFYNQHGSGRELSDTLKYRQRRGRITKLEKQFKRDGIYLRLGILRDKNRSDFRPEGELPIANLVIDQLDTHSVTRHDQAPVTHIPDG